MEKRKITAVTIRVIIHIWAARRMHARRLVCFVCV